MRYDIHNPDTSWNNRVQISRVQRDAQVITETWTLAYNPATTTTTIDRTSNLQALQMISTPGTAGRTETDLIGVPDANNNISNIAAKVKRVYQNFVWGEELVQEIANPDGSSPLVTTYTYYTSGWVNQAFSGNVTKLQSVTHPDGSWEKYDYYDDFARWGELAHVYRPRKDGPATQDLATLSNCQVTTYDYAEERNVYKELLASAVISTLGTTTGQTLNTPAISTNHAYNTAPLGDAPMRTDTIKSYAGANSSLTTTKTVFHNTAPLQYNGKLYSQINPDGTKVSASYVQGIYYDYTRATSFASTNFAPSTNGTGVWCETTLYGTQAQVSGSTQYTTDGMTNGKAIDPIWLTPFKSIRKQLVRDGNGNPQVELTQVYTGSGFDLIGWTTYSYSADGLLLSTLDNRGARTSASYIAGHMNYQTNPDGTQKQYWFDNLMRVTKTEVKGIAASGSYAAQEQLNISYFYDGAGRVTSTLTTNAGGTLSQTTSSTYNLAGQILTSTDASGLQTTYSYTNGGRTVTTTQPGGFTQVTDKFRDGQPRSTTGTGVIASYDYHDLSTASGESGFIVSKVYTATDQGPRWSQQVTDWLGRKVHEDKPAYSGGTFTKAYSYNSIGQLAKTTENGMAATLYQYNAFGQVEYTGIDLNNNGTLDLASTDRINQTETKFVYQNGAYWAQTLNYFYNQNNSATPTLASETDTKLVPYDDYSNSNYDNGIAFHETDSYDIFRNLTVKKSLTNRVSALVTQTTIVPNSTSNVVNITRNGLLQSSQNADAITTTYQYDAFQRLTATIDPRKGSTTQAYFASTDAVGSRQKLAWVKDAAGDATNYYYDGTTGRMSFQTDPLGKTTYFAFDALGHTIRTWGQATYPVEYQFNGYGEQITMRTFRDTSVSFTTNAWPYSGYPSANGDLTTWNFEAATGLLLSKTDAQNRSTAYTYNARGQLNTRTWARNVTSTYGYDANTAEQTSITYSDGTPNLTYAYDRHGLNASVVDVTGTRTFDHCVCGRVTAEYLPAFYQSRELHWTLDTTTPGALGRPTAMSSGTSGNGANEYSIGFGYDSYGRMNTVWGFNYTYAANSNLIASVADSRGAWAQYRTYEPNRDLYSGIETKYSTTSKAKFAYTSDALGRRTQRSETGDVFSSYNGGGLTTNWGYNDRSEVTSSQTFYYGTTTAVTGRAFGYSYDPIGNRLTSSIDGTISNYTANSLNQYTARDAAGQITASGFAPSNANVTVNGQAAARQGQYYLKNVPYTNTSSATWASLAIGSDLGGSVTRNAFLPQTPESYTYDNDGNILTDGRWMYSWDAENRLVSMETQAIAYNVGTPRQRLEFKYDYLGRRVLKRLLSWSGAAWSLVSEKRFLYDGWNLLEEFDTTTAFNRTMLCVWGIDLSGNLQDAGGVGGLLGCWRAETGTWMLPAYDANGNIFGMMDETTGSLRAVYEYGSFGETVRATGDAAAASPFRFSTKFTDNETQFVYYGHRYYDPRNGRFLGRDPTEEKGGLHLYAFVRNNGVNHADYLGLGNVYCSPNNINGCAGDPDIYPYWSDPRGSQAYAHAPAPSTSAPKPDSNTPTQPQQQNVDPLSSAGIIQQNATDYADSGGTSILGTALNSGTPAEAVNPTSAAAPAPNSIAGASGAGTAGVTGTDAIKAAALARYASLPPEMRKLVRDSFLDPATKMYAVRKTANGDVASEYQLGVGRYQKKSGEVYYQATTLSGEEHGTTDMFALIGSEYPEGKRSLTDVLHFHSHSDDRDPGLSGFDLGGYNRGAVYTGGGPAFTVPLDYSGAFYGRDQVFYGWSRAGQFTLTFDEMRDALK